MTLVRLLITLLAINTLFVALRLPAYPHLPWVAGEALFLSGAILLLRGSRARRFLAGASGCIFGLLVLAALADWLARHSLGRGLNLYLDLRLVDSLVNLLQTNIGPVLGWLALGLILIVANALAACMAFLLYSLRSAGGSSKRTGLTLLIVGSTGLLSSLWMRSPPVSATGVAMVAEQIRLARDTHGTALAFNQKLQQQADRPTALHGLATTDVILGFVESYGISTLSDERYAPLIGKRLGAMQDAFGKAGLSVVTGRLRSPVQGGQSWLAHATALSGQWVDSELDFDTLLAGNYPTLIDDLRATGHRTVAVMPAITSDWPDGRALGYDRVFGANDMEYQGPAFNWVTMPDQYTWSYLHDSILDKSDQPIFAELALISSHAPWVPILPVVEDWNTIAKGEVFNQWQGIGETPASLWRDPVRVREQFGRAIDYALQVATGYAVRHVDNNTLLVLLGDHQPAPLVTGKDASRDVVVHLISGNPELLAPFSEGAAALPTFRSGTYPAMDSGGPSMDGFRGFLHKHFSTQ